MSTNIYTAKFMQTIPPTPLGQHIEALHEMLYWGGIYGDALAIAEHHLHTVAVFTRHEPRYMIPPQAERRMMDPPPTLITRDEYVPAMPDPSTISAAMKKAVAGMSQAIATMRENMAAKNDSETGRQRAYKRRIEAERTAGLAHVKAEARRVRKELGL